jgi:hypothetical protein
MIEMVARGANPRAVVEIYNEPVDSTFTHNNHEYNLNAVLTATRDFPTKEFLVSDLTWIFDWDNPVDQFRIDNEDLSAPILVTPSLGKLVVVDGLHRLAKAQKLGNKTITGIEVSEHFIDQYRIG